MVGVGEIEMNMQLDTNIGQHTPKVVPVMELPFDMMEIPDYQRPYKWTVKNVNQLISDLVEFRHTNHYRLGTLVLSKNQIVDGQQRIVTLALLMQVIAKHRSNGLPEKYQSTMLKLDAFCARIHFRNVYSLHNVVENVRAIEERITEVTDEQLVTFLMEQCELVVVWIDDISEAFQFFDSQNARGKELAAHDLLKAYHLREMPGEKNLQCLTTWKTTKTDKLKELFLMLYRAKRWSQRHSARWFTKDEIEVFKGVSVDVKDPYPYYRLELLAHKSDEPYPYNLDDQIVNGSRFFEMICYYLKLERQMDDLSKRFASDSLAWKVLEKAKNHKGSYRSGDTYTWEMFRVAVMYYLDRFGHVELEKILPKLFLWAYRMRLVNSAVQQKTMDKYASQGDSMLCIIHEAKTPYDIINLPQPTLSMSDVKATKCDEIKDLFRQMKKLYGNE